MSAQHQRLSDAVQELIAAARETGTESDGDQWLAPEGVAQHLNVSLSRARGLLRDGFHGKINLEVIALPGSGTGQRLQLRVQRAMLDEWLRVERS